MKKMLSNSLLLAIAVAFVQLPVASDVYAAEPAKAEKKKRKSRAMSAFTGKKVRSAYELFEKEQVAEAVAELKEIEAKDPFDQAMVHRYIGGFLATIEKMDEAEKYIQLAVDADVLNTADHASAMKDLAGLKLQGNKYKEAIKYYYDWMDFTGKSDPDTWARIASARFSLKEYKKVIEPADNAIKTYKKPNKNPYILKLQAYYELKQYRNAVKVLEAAVLALPKEETFWTQLGNFYLLIEDYKKALYTLDMAYKQGFLKRESQLKTLASLYSQLDVPYKAAVLIDKYMKSGVIKKSESNLALLAGAWQRSMHIDKAASTYSRLAKISNDPKHYNQAGMLYKQDEQFTKALSSLSKALELGFKKKGAIHMAMAESYFYLEKYKQAYAEINKAMKDPKTKKVAKGWKGFIKAKAERNKVSI